MTVRRNIWVLCCLWVFKSLSIPSLPPFFLLSVSGKLKKLIDNASRTLVNLPFSLRGVFEFHHVDGTNGCLTEVTACTVV